MTSSLSEAFQDIRPYEDGEVKEVIARILADQEFIDAIVRFKYPKLRNYLGWLLNPAVAFALRRQASKIGNIRDFQRIVSFYMDRMIHKSTTGLTVTGIDKLQPGKAYLFISNHRDIAMDPAFVNYALWHNQHDTVRIAIGDNLLRKPYVSDLMRLNKSFIVKRSAKGVREMMATYLQLSTYIDSSIADGHSIWIAQREGRAKDGKDLTDPAIIKMFYMFRKKEGLSFAEAMQRLHIVPVSISYEYNPCDQSMARELYALAEQGGYEKSQFEDIQSIVRGIVGFKGQVHVAFGDEIVEPPASPEELAELIDRQILDNYFMHGSNLTAAKRLGVSTQQAASAEQQTTFDERLEGLSEGQRAFFLEMYAAPVRRKLALEQQ
ncbi:acyltransferase [Pokkaliibacter plantistimulans]|uniref:Acyltransferase n=1 Tax=Pokkaliibacter plantistimulans TaxID=1635171 RepID=A0ABX5LU24_9GAMM|nr:1-acyl-sn-glycerol-3-phosphate acyltransferase [Pokkaliibacter plantistimulans]PXF30176.1 acyltransferase [Pokkaliibacter plantistimulans]